MKNKPEESLHFFFIVAVKDWQLCLGTVDCEQPIS